MVFSCKCGEENILFRKKDKNTYNITIKCFDCEMEHSHSYSLKDLIDKDLLFRCISGIGICFIGDDGLTDRFINDDESLSKNFLELELDDYFKDFKILTACLNKVDRMMDSGKIYCNCGNHDINIDVFTDRIEISCLNCGSVQIIYAETEEDLDLLLRKRRIVMDKHNISCIDSIVEKNKDLK